MLQDGCWLVNLLVLSPFVTKGASAKSGKNVIAVRWEGAPDLCCARGMSPPKAAIDQPPVSSCRLCVKSLCEKKHFC